MVGACGGNYGRSSLEFLISRERKDIKKTKKQN